MLCIQLYRGVQAYSVQASSVQAFRGRPRQAGGPVSTNAH